MPDPCSYGPLCCTKTGRQTGRLCLTPAVQPFCDPYWRLCWTLPKRRHSTAILSQECCTSSNLAEYMAKESPFDLGIFDSYD